MTNRLLNWGCREWALAERKADFGMNSVQAQCVLKRRALLADTWHVLRCKPPMVLSRKQA